MIGSHPPGTARYEIHRLLDAVLDKIEGKMHGLLSDTPGKRAQSKIFKADPDFDSFIKLAKRLGIPVDKQRSSVAGKQRKKRFIDCFIGIASLKLVQECKSQRQADIILEKMTGTPTDTIAKMRTRMTAKEKYLGSLPINDDDRLLFSKAGFDFIRQYADGKV